MTFYTEIVHCSVCGVYLNTIQYAADEPRPKRIMMCKRCADGSKKLPGPPENKALADLSREELEALAVEAGYAVSKKASKRDLLKLLESGEGQ